MLFYDFSGFFPDFFRMFFTTFSGIFLRKNGLEYGITSETTGALGASSETTGALGVYVVRGGRTDHRGDQLIHGLAIAHWR